jgi:hypothetical protein
MAFELLTGRSALKQRSNRDMVRTCSHSKISRIISSLCKVS